MRGFVIVGGWMAVTILNPTLGCWILAGVGIALMGHIHWTWRKGLDRARAEDRGIDQRETEPSSV